MILGCSFQFSRSVVSDSLQPHESQHARPPCPSPTPRVHSNSHPSSQWYHPAISTSVIPFSSCPQSPQTSGSFPMSHLFAWCSQSTRVSALASVLPKNTQDWSPLGWTGWTFLHAKGLSRVFSNTTVQKHRFFGTQLSSQSNSYILTWPFFNFFKIKFHLFILAVLGLCCCLDFSLVEGTGATLQLQYAGFSLPWLSLLKSRGSSMCGFQ